ncbi:hypothetical protein B0O99DRAFT_624080 [Bisporella sp. PMI_857]|nr:hypothetical protein B0O99DRAFT_624080 [Bisporella sp. PMI_857]
MMFEPFVCFFCTCVRACGTGSGMGWFLCSGMYGSCLCRLRSSVGREAIFLDIFFFFLLFFGIIKHW